MRQGTTCVHCGEVIVGHYYELGVKAGEYYCIHDILPYEKALENEESRFQKAKVVRPKEDFNVDNSK